VNRRRTEDRWLLILDRTTASALLVTGRLWLDVGVLLGVTVASLWLVGHKLPWPSATARV
jgi:hypothetical protein